VTILVDTPVWSIAYRRAKRNLHDERVFDEWSTLVRQQEAAIIGPIRQEVLGGFANTARFELLRATLRAFIDLPLVVEDFEQAADLHNRCRRQGVQGSPADFLICAVSLRLDAPIFTTDRDFERYAQLTSVRLHAGPFV
jgi:predicted nucleic acid-binding protein